MLEILSEVILSVAGIVIPAIFTWLGTKINAFLKEKMKKEIVVEVVNYVEKACSKLSSAEKYQEALSKASEWLESKNISVSETELNILIESAVNNLSNEIKKGE